MKVILPRPATNDMLFAWLMHRFAQVFEDHAILKGGMALRLLDSSRSTTDIDYVFVPYKSKKEILPQIRKVLEELPDARINIELHSKMLRAEVAIDSSSVQLEASVGLECSSIPMSTSRFAEENNQSPQIVRIMSPDCALAHKLAAWNERRLLRDLYDCYFFVARVGELPKRQVLDTRLAKIHSKLPRLKTRGSMTRDQLASELRTAIADISEKTIDNELAPLLPSEEIVGLATRMRVALNKLADNI